MTNETQFTKDRKGADALAIGQILSLFPRWEFKEHQNRYTSPFHFNGKRGNGENIFIYKDAKGEGYNVQENGGEGRKCSLYDFFCEDRGILEPEKMASLQQYADAVGYALADTEEAKERAQRERAQEMALQQREAQINAFVAKRNEILTAQTPEGDTLRAFFEARGWGLDYLDKWRIGYDVANNTNPLTIPVFRNGRTCQITRRWIRSYTKEDKDAYKNRTGYDMPEKYHRERGEGKASFLGFAPIPSRLNPKPLFICEGEADAMALNNAGFAGACSFSCNINGGQLEEIRQRVQKGLKDIYLIVDDDKKADGTDGTGYLIAPTNARKLIAEGLNVHIITFSDVEGVKDADDYFCKSKHTPEQFAERVKNAPTFARYMANRARKEYKQSNDLNKYFEDVAGLMAEAEANNQPADYMALFQGMEANANADGYLFRLFERFVNTHTEAKAPAPSGRAEASALEEQTAFFPEYQKGDIWKIAGRFTPEINTGYVLETMDAPEDAEPWTIPANEITLICGYTSHGKTKVLQNLFLKMAGDPTIKGRFLFVSYEEPDGGIIRELVNIKVNQNLTQDPKKKPNLEVIGEFIQSGGATECNGYAMSVKNAVEELDAMATAGRIKFKETKATAEALASSIRAEIEKYKGDTQKGEIKAVFVDYIQLLETEDADKQTTAQMLKGVIMLLQQIAKDTQTAIICGAQLRREERDKNPLYITESDIADSAYLERTAGEIVVIYDGNRLKGREFAQIATNKNGNPAPSDGQKRLFEKGFACVEAGEKIKQIEAPERMYIKIPKHRGRRAGVEGVLRYTPTTGNISQLPAEVWTSPVWLNTAKAFGLVADNAEQMPSTQAQPPKAEARGAKAMTWDDLKPAEPQPVQQQPQQNPIEGMDGGDLPF